VAAGGRLQAADFPGAGELQHVARQGRLGAQRGGADGAGEASAQQRAAAADRRRTAGRHSFASRPRVTVRGAPGVTHRLL